MSRSSTVTIGLGERDKGEKPKFRQRNQDDPRWQACLGLLQQPCAAEPGAQRRRPRWRDSLWVPDRIGAHLGKPMAS
ncbi:hypothetical protein NDU88_003600 [Pleurodeles waltl]|uniref:Uncharacterized protein n=1 Tax=Pleurodeles waltl TaxID=8319 RepID=A0AAV7LM31_PLEWA|nr:hypothetical protein NDU88_003600 [Pleurodeles waltl]